MKNSLIISSLMHLFSIVSGVFKESVTYKILNKIIGFIKDKFFNSFFISLFTLPVSGNYASGSKILSFFAVIIGWVRRMAAKIVVAPLRRSLVVRYLAEFYSNILNYSLCHWGISICSFAIVYSALAFVFGALTQGMLSVAIIVTVFGVVCCVIKTSTYNFFTGSIVMRAFGGIFGAVDFEDRDTIAVNRHRAILCSVFGILVALASVISHPLYVAVFVVGILSVGWIIYDYTVGIFIATVILAVSPTMALVGLIMLTFMSFLLKFARDDSMCFKRTPMDIPILFFAGVLMISAVTSFAFMSSVMAVMVYIAFILSYYLLTNSITSKQRLYCLIVCVLFVGLFVAAYGIYQHIFGFDEGKVWTDTDMFEDIETRVVSTFENPNVLGEYLLLLIPIGVGVIMGIKNGFHKLMHLAVVAVLSLCMIYTYSRGNWIGLMVALVVFFAFYNKRFMWLAVIALCLLPFFMPENVINRFLSVGDMDDSSTSYRVYIWLGTLKMLKDYWMCGIGIGTEAFEKIYNMYALSAITAPHSHNLYLQIITENGILGIITFAVVMAVYFKMCISSVIACKDKLVRSVIIGLASGMLGYLVQGLFDNVWYNYRVFLLFFIILGISAACTELSKKLSTEVTQC